MGRSAGLRPALGVRPQSAWPVFNAGHYQERVRRKPAASRRSVRGSWSQATSCLEVAALPPIFVQALPIETLRTPLCRARPSHILPLPGQFLARYRSKNPCCAIRNCGYVSCMNWQQILLLVVIVVAAVVLVWRSSGKKAGGCGCKCGCAHAPEAESKKESAGH